MRTLKVAVVVMGVLIVAGVATVVATIVGRVGGLAQPSHPLTMLLDEPAGARIAGAQATADRLAVTVQGGGPDRVVVVDLRSGAVIARVALAR